MKTSSSGSSGSTSIPSRFPIPSSLQDLEHAPYNLLPYPASFQDDSDAARAASFASLVAQLQLGNRELNGSGMSLFPKHPSEHKTGSGLVGVGDNNDDDDDSGDLLGGDEEAFVEGYERWMDEDRVQALYTLVRKSNSLAPALRESLVETIVTAVQRLSNILEDADETVSQDFRDAFACHIYMLYCLMFFEQSEAANSSAFGGGGSKSSTATSGLLKSGKKSSRSKKKSDDTIAATNDNGLRFTDLEIRTRCVDCMLRAATVMKSHAAILWQRGVPDESVVMLPLRISYVLLERATGAMARKAVCADQALRMIAVTVDNGATQNRGGLRDGGNYLGSSTLRTSVAAALMDLMHSHEHMAALAAELCGNICKDQSLAVELLREMGRLEVVDTSDNSKAAIGIKYSAPFLNELARWQPRLVLQNLSHVLNHLNSDPYYLRSALVTAVGHILEYLGKQQQSKQSVESSQDSAALDDEPVEEDGIPFQAHAPLDISKSRNALFDLLSERVFDVSSYTRSAVLKAWISLVETGSLPKDRVVPVTKIAMDRVQDKTVIVRKQAMQLLTTLLENNPFMGSLDPQPYRVKLGELYEFLKENMPANIRDAHKPDTENGADGEALREIESAALAAAMAEADSWDSDGVLTEERQEYFHKVQALKFTQSALDFIEIFEHATQALEGMLLSANTSDVTEALRFFVQARHFQLPCAVTGMKRAMALMWSSEASIRDEVLKAFVEVFIAVPGSEGKDFLPDEQIAANLLVVTGKASVSELASIEEAIARLVKEERIPADVFSLLWKQTSKGPAEVRATALHLIAMGAAADRSIVDGKKRLKLLLDSGLGDFTERHTEWRLARAAASALQKIGRAKVDPSDAKYLVIEQIIEQLIAVVRGDWCNDNDQQNTVQWFSAAQQSVKSLFVVCPQPEVACSIIIRGMYSSTFVDGSNSCHSLRLARFFFALGQIAMNLLVHTEGLTASVRRGNAKKSLKKQEEADKAKNRNKKSGDTGQVEDAIEAELGMAAEADAENERKLAEISEKEILGRGLISPFQQLLVRVVGNEGGKFSSEVLMQASMVALCNCMCVSRSFCETYLPLLFTALANAPPEDTVMRANTVVALGDLAFRFPNEVEPYTPRLYACLRDSSKTVRRHTLMVLTHLILNDMVKVKGQVCEIALCLRDDDPRIRDMSRLLFNELSKRSNNPVYNLLPDIISQLSQLSMPRDDFRGIISFLFGFIKKDKQHEMLTEKLCHRFPKCSDISQKADIAYCLSLLKTNEKSIKFLSDNFKLYKDALFDEDVLKSFATIVGKAKKSTKPELRQFLDEWESKLNEFAELGVEDQIADQKASKARSRATKRSTKRKGPEKKLKAVSEEDHDESDVDGDADDSEEDVTNDKENTPSTTLPNRRRPRASRRAR